MFYRGFQLLRAIALAVCLSVGGLASAFAIPVPPATPDAQLDLEVLGNGNVPDIEYHGPYGAGPTEGLLNFDAAYGSLGAQAVIAPETTVSVFSSLTGGEVQGAAFLSYFAQVTGPAGLPVPIELTGAVSVSSAGSGINLNAIVVAFPGIAGLDAASLCGNDLQLEVFTSSAIDEVCRFTLAASVMPNTVFGVDVWAESLALGPQNPMFLVATDSLKIDPILSIDPTFANAGEYSIELSPGVGNSLDAVPVPEPSSLELLAAGIVGLAGLSTLSRRHRIFCREPISL